MAYGKSQMPTRREDMRLLTGRGRYVDDIVLPGMAHAEMVYSDLPHGLLNNVDTAAARAAPGVIAVLTGADCAAGGLHGILPRYLPQAFGFGEALPIPRPCLVTDRVRHVGDRIAMVIAETRQQAQHAATLVAPDIAPLPHAVTLAQALGGAATIHEERPDNVAYTLRIGDREAAERAFAGAASTHSIDYGHPRVTANSLETRAGIGSYSEADGLFTLHTTTQNPHILRAELANMALRVPESMVRVLTDTVGGGFGMKTSTFPEDALLLWAARLVGRPVKWVCSRSDGLRSDEHGRGSSGTVEIALDADARLLAMRVRYLQDVGAYMVGAGPMPTIHTARLLAGVYDIPVIEAEGRAVFTNNPAVVPYRGAGRPEGIFAIEQALDRAARDLGLSPVEIRRRNFIRPERMPHRTQVNFTYDTGEFEALLDACLAKADWDGFEARRARDAGQGLLRGRGLGLYIHDTGSMNEQAEITFNPGGTVTLVSGTTDTGQGHHTTFAHQVAGRLGIDPEHVRVIQGDTDKVAFGRGSFASRSVTMVGSAIEVACDRIIEKGRFFAALVLETEAERIRFDPAGGVFSDQGSNRSLTIAEVAAASFRPYMPITDSIGLSALGAFKMTAPSFPNGCHVAEVTIDPETGEVRVERYTVVDDLGNMLNPRLCEGQIHGAVAMGIGESLMERICMDEGGGQLLSGSFLDYAMPRADHMPPLETAFRPVPCTTNPGGFKGAGEGGTVGSLSTLKHAVLDALAPLGVRDIEKPMTSQRIWQAVAAARARDGTAGPDV
ncbi:MAG: xanthine dehydrogenase family protein molybdopterin-binding subunit [Sneathiellaceae bacterium]